MSPDSLTVKRLAPLYWFLIFAALFSLQVLPRLSQDSPVGDENSDIVDGYYYWTGDVCSTADHPPLAKALQALPLWTMGLHLSTNLSFLSPVARDAYFLSVLNRDHFEAILTGARLVTWGFGLALGWILFGMIRRESIYFILTVMTLWAFEPGLLAFSGFAMADLPLAFFVLAAVIQFQKSLSDPSRKQAVLTGLLTGMAVTVKFTAFLLVPIFLILEGVGREGSWKVAGRKWAWGLGTAFLWLGLAYLPGTLSQPDHPWPWLLFWNGMKTVMSLDFVRQYYFKGVLSFQNHWDYYPTAFVLKSPLTFLILLAAGIALALRRQIQWSAWQWVPPLVFFGAFLFFHNMGIRMILPVYPFCLLMAGRTGEWMAQNPRRFLPPAWVSLLVFQVLSVGLRYPAQVGYFNELISPDRRLYWLGDSNLDFGQDTRRLALAARAHGWDHVKLAYFGIADPKIYGMNWSYWTQKDLAGPQPGWVYAVNDEYIQMGPAYSPWAKTILGSWILKAAPIGRVGDTWFYFEIPGKIQSDDSPRIVSAPVFLDDSGAFSKTAKGGR